MSQHTFAIILTCAAILFWLWWVFRDLLIGRSARTYVVTAYRWGHRDNHSYVVACVPEFEKAVKLAESHVDYRGGKYGCEVTDETGRQVHYIESSYYGSAGRHSPSCHPVDRKKPFEYNSFVCGKCFKQLSDEEKLRHSNATEWLNPQFLDQIVGGFNRIAYGDITLEGARESAMVTLRKIKEMRER